jgi:hypothetical protein
MVQVIGSIEHLLVVKKVKMDLHQLNYLGQYIQNDLKNGETNKTLF